MSLKNKSLGLFLFLTVYISSCANQSSPTGGPKDENPPVLEVSIPQHESLNYTDNKITLEFNEYVKLNNPKEEIIITPRILGEYDIKYKKNKVIIILEDSLLSNTTYTFNFREGIQDLNESNSPPDFQMAFSTGDYLDSLSISGNVYNLLSNDPDKNITVSLYDANDTLDVFNSPPIYFTKSNDAGDFTFKNLKNGTYNIYALNDQNKNLTLESNDESYAYVDYTIKLDSNIASLKLPLINLNNAELLLQSAKTRGHYFVLKYNKYVSSYQQSPINGSKSVPSSSFSDDHKQIVVYNPQTITDSLAIIINAFDTINNVSTDTVFVKFEDTKRKKDPFEVNYNKVSIDKELPIINTEVTFTKPIIDINFDSLYIQIDSISQISFDSSDFTWNNQRTKLSIEKTLNKSVFDNPEEGTSKDSTTAPNRRSNDLLLYFGQLAFLSVEQDSSTNHTEKISFINSANFGSILVKVETKATSFFTQLLDTKGKVVTETYNKKEFSFENINPATYQIRVLIDSNQNKKWDIGDINKNIVPEPVIFYISDEGTSEITLRANWELGPNLIKY